MGFEFSIKFDEREFDGFIQRNLLRKIAVGCRQGLNRTATGTSKEGTDQIKSVFNSRAIETSKAKSEIGNRIIKAVGENISNMRATVKAKSKKGVMLSRFAKPKSKQKQAGIAVHKRKGASYEFKKGHRVKTSRSFLQRGKGGNLVAYRARAGVNRKGRLKVLRYKTYTAMLQDRDVLPTFESKMSERLQKNIDASIGNALRNI